MLGFVVLKRHFEKYIDANHKVFNKIVKLLNIKKLYLIKSISKRPSISKIQKNTPKKEDSDDEDDSAGGCDIDDENDGCDDIENEGGNDSIGAKDGMMLKLR